LLSLINEYGMVKEEVWCLRCGKGAPECLHGKEWDSWTHDRIWIKGKEITGTSYCCEEHHGSYEEFLERFLESPVIPEHVKEIIRNELTC